ncbi:MAG: FkbM family methyltransferase [Deltaproteobacteria bacterium]|nr:FkbM family methyltransferase [Deltaproteobacteria bacterium]
MPLDTLRLIWNNPANVGHRMALSSRWLTWNIWRRISRVPKTLPYFGYDLIAYPDCSVSCLIAYSHGGLYDYDYMNFFIRFIDSEDVVLDVGANIGAYTLLFARYAYRGEVVGFEPEPTTFARLSENVGRNRLEGRVQLVNKAVGEEEGSLRFSIGDKSSTHHVALDRDNPTEKKWRYYAPRCPMKLHCKVLIGVILSR